MFYCLAVQLCKPNPCKHGGHCSMVSVDTYKCDCFNTGYIGKTCDMGLIEVPSFPTLEEGETSNVLTITAHPNKEIIITPNVPSQRVLFQPKVLRIASPNTQVTFNIRSVKNVGQVRINFELSGESKNDFLMLSLPVIHVVNHNHTVLTRILDENILTNQCFSKNIGKCQNNYMIKLASCCPWEDLNTKGHLSVGTDNLRLPFSLSGFSLPSASQILSSNELLTPRVNIAEMLRNGNKKCEHGSCHSCLSKHEHDYVLRNNIFVRAYLKQISSLAPWYFNMNLNPEYKGFDASNFQSLFYNGKIYQDIPGCANLPQFSKQYVGMYSIFTTTAPIDIQFMSNYFYVKGIAPSCVVVDICQKVYYLSLPLTKSVDATHHMKESGFTSTKIVLSGLSISKGNSVIKKCMDIYTGAHMITENICVSGNIWSKFSLMRQKGYYNFTFDGDAAINISDVIKVRITYK